MTGNDNLRPMPELVSVVIPAFNAEHYLTAALESALNEATDEVHVDIIVVDDGSSDGTRAIAQRYAPRVRYFLREHSGRPAIARNYGLRQANGSWIAFLDADDFWLPGSLVRRLTIMQRDTEVGFVYGNYFTLRNGERSLHFDAALPPSGWIFDKLFRNCFIDTSSVLVRKDLLDAAGGFAEHVHTAEDYYLWLQLAWRAKAVFVPTPVAVKHVHSDSISHCSLTRKLYDLITVTAQIAEAFDLTPHLVRERITPLRLWLARTLFAEHRHVEGLAQLLRAIWNQPRLALDAGSTLLRRHNVEDVVS